MQRIDSLLIAVLLGCSASLVYAADQNSYETTQDQQKKTTGGISFNQDNGLTYRSPEKHFKAVAKFLFRTDFMSIYGSSALQGGADIPKAKLYLDGTFYDLFYGFSYDFSRGGQLDNLYAGYQYPDFDIMLGQASPYYGLSNSTSSKALIFLQDSLPVYAFSPSYGKGGFLNANYKDFSSSISILGPRFSDKTSDFTPLTETLRLVYAPWHQEYQVLHFGVSLWNQGVIEDNEVNFSTSPEIEPVNEGELINTSDIQQVSHYFTGDLEFAIQKGPWGFQSEYSHSWVSRQHNLPALQFSGYYLSSSYFLTGESRTYTFPSGYYSGISQVKHPYGAWQVAARYSTLDLNSRSIQGGKEHNVTLGVNWYLNSIVEFMFNYIHADANPNSTGSDTSANIYALQLQLYL